MQQYPRIPFQPDLRILAIGPEASYRLGDCLETARLTLKPRGFAEDCFVEEMAISRWRGIRTKIMEKAVYDHQATTYRPRDLKSADGSSAEPYEDMYHLAMAHSPENSRIVLTALGRLETRYYRNFCTAFRLLLAARRGTPPPVHDPSDASPESKTELTTEIEKENTKCAPYPNSSHTTK